MSGYAPGLKSHQASLESIKSYYIYSNKLLSIKSEAYIIEILIAHACMGIFKCTFVLSMFFAKFIFHVFCIKYDIIIND